MGGCNQYPTNCLMLSKRILQIYFFIVINVSCGALSHVHCHSFRWFLQKCNTLIYISLQNQFNVRWSTVPNLLLSTNNFLFLCTYDEAAVLWRVAYFCLPLSFQDAFVCVVNTWFMVIYCHILNSYQLFQFRVLPTKLS
jgi:hypothetical protein